MFKGNLTRLLLASSLICALTAPLGGEPPPMPRFSVKNNTAYTITGEFQCHYEIKDTNQGWYLEFSGTWAPGAYTERSFTHRLKFVGAQPLIAFVTTRTVFKANGVDLQNQNWRPLFSTDRPADATMGTAHGKTFYGRVATGNANSRDFVDITITN